MFSLGGGFLVQFFPGLSPCNCLQGRLQWEHLRGAFFVRSFARDSSVQFYAGFFYLHCLVGSFYTLSCGAFILHFSARQISISSFVGAISERYLAVPLSVRFIAELFPRLFCEGFFSCALSQEHFICCLS